MAEIFQPVRGTQKGINQMPIRDGYVYFAYDTGKVYMDKDGARYPIGGSSSGIIYARGGDATIVKVLPDVDTDRNYRIALTALEDKNTIPMKDSLILNSDGRFFRVVSVNSDTELINAQLLAVSGTGGGGTGTGGGGIAYQDLSLEWDEKTIGQGHTFIYGVNSKAIFTPTSDTDRYVSLTFTITDNEHDNAETRITESRVRSGERYIFDTSKLPLSSNITMKVTIYASNSLMQDQSRTYNIPYLSTVEMGIIKPLNANGYLPLVKPDDAAGTQTLYYMPIGDKSNTSIKETLHVYIDGTEDLSYKTAVPVEYYNKGISIPIRRQSHGTHIIELSVSAEVNGSVVESNRISYQAAWAAKDEETPIIWVGDYDETVINYENSYIKFMVYDPVQARQKLKTSVNVYKNGKMISEMEVEYSETSWITLDISDIYDVGENNFSLVCRSERKDISVYVTTEGSRDLGLAQANSLLVNFTSAGRSNMEVKGTRGVWKDKLDKTSAILNGFNWQNNGWRADGKQEDGIDNGTYLYIANGAKVEIPSSAYTLNSQKDYTIEARFRIRNTQKYSTLIQVVGQYYYVNGYTDEGAPIKSTTSLTLADIENQGKEVYKDEWGNPLMDEDNTQKIPEYENGVICKWVNDNKYGMVLGSQEAFFRSPRGIINVRYKEDEVINITVVVSRTDGLVYIYLNGILSGADALPPAGNSGAFTINSPFIFNSDYCDVDLYRFRIYEVGLAMPDVIHNYLSDIHSITLYDQNQLTDSLTPTCLSYNMLVDYNKEHPENVSMPYAVWKVNNGTSRAEKLPFFKGDKLQVDVRFVNPSLDQALNEYLEDEAKGIAAKDRRGVDPWYYYTHSPSFEATGVDIDVQGTSSQAYPRRNYKTKFKKAKTWTYTNGPLAGQPLSGVIVNPDKTETKVSLTAMDRNGVEHKVSKKFHMDNEILGTNKFTWKIDYMESSGSYNTGFANLMGNSKSPLYTKHPLDDIKSGLGEGMRTSVYGFPVLVFHEYENYGNNPNNKLVEGNTETYEYIGRYNMNLDKGSNEYYGFEVEDEQPYITLKDGSHPKICDIAECWELEDNQGTWTSFRYPTAEARQNGFNTRQGESGAAADRLEVPLHFEYRYSHYEDQIDAIGADGKYDGTTAKQEIIDEIGTTDAAKSVYLRKRYENLEQLFNWLDSTDQDAATNLPLKEPAILMTAKDYTTHYIYTQVVSDTREEGVNYYVKNEDSGNETYELFTRSGDDELSGKADGEEKFNARFKNLVSFGLIYTRVMDPESEVKSVFDKEAGLYSTTFVKDSKDYRTEKFRTEFNLHLDKEYCAVYFIMTELLLCYDSRGKNMMLATFGPTAKSQGNYIWYPIFYDIDTQLGLNNSGAYLWDYDADVTKDGLFSTANSVLWTNFYAAFEEDIKNKYRALRGQADGSNTSNSLRYETISGAYSCDPTVFDSYAMRGVRPTIAIGLDEYYKYFATTKTGYFNLKGETVVESAPEFAYACQGDKKLTTELLLRNRLNYIDSWWLGGTYHINQVKSGQLTLRISANNALLTSDKYLDVDEITGEAKTQGFVKATYPKPYFDAQPGYKLKPFLKQYVTYFTDEIPSSPVKYTGADDQVDGVRTSVPESTAISFRSSPNNPAQQLNYIPGMDYISSLGDLSISYPDEFRLSTGKRLLDLRLGSDIPGYKNAMINNDTIFTLSDGVDQDGKPESGAKPLLKQIILTGLTTLNKTLDVRGSEKLQEFRALNTLIPQVYFASGAPLHTVHLPSSIGTLELNENKDLTRILTSRPQVATLDDSGVAKYADPSEYRGLYVESITDYNEAQKGKGHVMSNVSISGGGLGYGSYEILRNLVDIKKGAAENKTLQVNLKDVNWTPYVQVEYGETYNSDETYYLLTDHSTYVGYTYTSDKQFDNDTLNSLVYTYNSSMDKNTIPSLDLIDYLIEQYEEANQSGAIIQFANMDSTYLPTITGELFVANKNGRAIPEEDLTKKYKQYFSNLHITAENVAEANIVKYVKKLDSGKIETVESLRTSDKHPLAPTAQIPTANNKDFYGWATDPEGTNLVITYNYDLQNSENGVPDAKYYRDMEESLNNLTFTDENKVITLYAIFGTHKHKVSFMANGELVGGKPLYIEYGAAYREPAILPHKDDSDLPLEQTYKFNGYSSNKDDTESVSYDFEPPKTITKDIVFYATFSQESVYDNILSEDAFTFYDGALSFNGNVIPSGKVTIPATYKGQPVTSFSTGYGSIRNSPITANITHVFFEQENNQITSIGDYGFGQMKKLVYVKLPNKNMSIGLRSFDACSYLFKNSQITQDNVDDFFDSVSAIGDSAFNNCNLIGYNYDEGYHTFCGDFILNIPGNVTIGESAFNQCQIKSVILGSAEVRCNFNNIATGAFSGASYGSINASSDGTYPDVTIYAEPRNLTADEVKTRLFLKSGASYNRNASTISIN